MLPTNEAFRRLSALEAEKSFLHGAERGCEWAHHLATPEQLNRLRAISADFWERFEAAMEKRENDLVEMVREYGPVDLSLHDPTRIETAEWLAIQIEGLLPLGGQSAFAKFWDSAIGVVGDGGEWRLDPQFILGFAAGALESLSESETC